MQHVRVEARRERGWAPTADGIGRLRRSARQLARSSATRIAKPEVGECLRRLKVVMALERVCKLMIGDLLVLLIDGHELRAIDIARQTGYRPADVSEMLKTARTFPPALRPTGVPYNLFLLATRMIGRFPDLSLTPLETLDQIRGRRLSQHRDVTRYFAALARETYGRQKALPAPAGLYHNRAYHGRFQDLLPSIPDGAVAILSIDPPYVYGDEAYRSRSARNRDCDNADPESAVALVVDLLRDWQPKLAPGGVVLLWQPWQPLLGPILQAVQVNRWELVGPIIWDKGRPQPGRFDSPYSIQGEMLWILHRPGDRLINHDGGSREMILRFPPVSSPGLSQVQAHMFEKPVELCELLVRKHSRPDDLVLDACGCTGSMSVAAINCGRRWIYAESNAENYRLGAGRINAKLAERTAVASCSFAGTVKRPILCQLRRGHDDAVG